VTEVEGWERIWQVFTGGSGFFSVEGAYFKFSRNVCLIYASTHKNEISVLIQCHVIPIGHILSTFNSIILFGDFRAWQSLWTYVHRSDFLFLCSTENITYMFGGLANNDNIFIFWEYKYWHESICMVNNESFQSCGHRTVKPCSSDTM